jgi:hypothetical protein
MATVPGVPYPPRRTFAPLPAFRGTASSRPDPAVQAQVEAFIVEQYAAGRSLRELAELTDRSFSAVRNILDRHGLRRREVGAAPMSADPAADETEAHRPAVKGSSCSGAGPLRAQGAVSSFGARL